jgi:Family of unknown function (DUF6491)
MSARAGRSHHPSHIVATALLGALLGTLLAGCASAPAQTTGAGARHAAAALPGTPGCFWLRNFDGSWTALSQTELIVYAPLTGDNAYYIKLFEPVINLQFDERLGFEDFAHSGQICDGAADFLIVPNYAPHRITIVAVRHLSRPEIVQLLRSHGQKVPKYLLVPAVRG